ncbi:hypothetical protein [Anaeromyxobacter oryzae]|uniref:Uncharacterized protein n=1 Tax=Anaeromyxobacter oryzae TaxID=2918170 RepID=A0ABM7WPL0_9BACT|nr:hypothetical protein [Anaeromyxobacter oryzae]BDG01397.1 hypothetical protein AMOR_03930 [Anaeromyxobacter oryzae]
MTSRTIQGRKSPAARVAGAAADGAEVRRARRVLAGGAVAIALLFGGAVAILSREPGSAPAVRPGAPAAPGRDPAPLALAAPEVPTPPPAAVPRPVPATRPPPPAPERVPGVIPRAAPHRLPRGSPAPVELFAGLAALQASVAECAREHRGPAPGSAAAPAGQAVFMLDLETLDHRVRIVEAPVQARGAATEDALACARGVLLGHEIPVQVARPGSRIQLPLAVKL